MSKVACLEKHRQGKDIFINFEVFSKERCIVFVKQREFLELVMISMDIILKKMYVVAKIQSTRNTTSCQE